MNKDTLKALVKFVVIVGYNLKSKTPHMPPFMHISTKTQQSHIYAYKLKCHISTDSPGI